jgi:hypothetical protein
MGMKKIKRKISDLIDDAYFKGWNKGWDRALENTDENEFENGWDARSENVTERLEGLYEAYVAARKWKEAEHVKEIIDYLNFVVKPTNETPEKD